MKNHCKNFKSVCTFFKVHTTDCGMLWSHVELVTYTQLILGLISLLLQSSRRKLSSLQQQISFAPDLDILVLLNNGFKLFLRCFSYLSYLYIYLHNIFHLFITLLYKVTSKYTGKKFVTNVYWNYL